MKLNKIEKIQLTISFFLRITLVIAIINTTMKKSWISLFLAIFTLILTFIPSIIEKNYKIYLPAELELMTIFFIYASIFLGEVHGYYTLFWWWDLMLHGMVGLALGLIGFLIIYILYSTNKIKTSPILIALFSFFFAIAIGTIWEIFEFLADILLNINMQKSGLIDTMTDMMINAVAAFLVATASYFYAKFGKSPILDKLVKNFIKKNPKIFK